MAKKAKKAKKPKKKKKKKKKAKKKKCLPLRIWEESPASVAHEKRETHGSRGVYP